MLRLVSLPCCCCFLGFLFSCGRLHLFLSLSGCEGEGVEVGKISGITGRDWIGSENGKSPGDNQTLALGGEKRERGGRRVERAPLGSRRPMARAP